MYVRFTPRQVSKLKYFLKYGKFQMSGYDVQLYQEINRALEHPIDEFENNISVPRRAETKSVKNNNIKEQDHIKEPEYNIDDELEDQHDHVEESEDDVDIGAELEELEELGELEDQHAHIEKQEEDDDELEDQHAHIEKQEENNNNDLEINKRITQLKHTKIDTTDDCEYQNNQNFADTNQEPKVDLFGFVINDTSSQNNDHLDDISDSDV